MSERDKRTVFKSGLDQPEAFEAYHSPTEAYHRTLLEPVGLKSVEKGMIQRKSASEPRETAWSGSWSTFKQPSLSWFRGHKPCKNSENKKNVEMTCFDKL